MAEGNDLSRMDALHTIKLDADGLRLIAGVYHLDDHLTCLLVEDAAGEEAVLSRLTCDRLAVHRQREHIRSLVHGEKLLYIVAHRLEGAEIIEPDGIRTPLPALDMGKERSIGRHVDDVGITLDTRHVGSLVE